MQYPSLRFTQPSATRSLSLSLSLSLSHTGLLIHPHHSHHRPRSPFRNKMERDITTAAVNAVLDPIFRGVEGLVTSLWDLSLGLLVNLLLLPRNLKSLADEMKRLQELRDDLRDRVEREARPARQEPTNRVSGWMERVGTLSSEVTQLEDSFYCRSICHTASCLLCLAHGAAERLKEVRKLTAEGTALCPGGEQLVRPQAPVAVEEVPFETSSSSLVGRSAEDALQKIKGHVMDDEVGIVGIWGMGGIGKTTLLSIINNEFLREEACRRRFDVAIFVVVSKDADLSNIRKTIGQRLGLSQPNDGDNNAAPEANLLWEKLSQKPFVLLLDDVWQELNLGEIGIPRKKGCKIIFTTRSEEVCTGMGADRTVNVGLLDDNSSWELFKSKVGNRVDFNDSVINSLAEQVVAKCGGLPISLITVGKAMGNATLAVDWRTAIGKLDRCAHTLSGMEDRVLTPLKFSYDRLNDDTLRSCLSYCALFPEDCSIPKERIIDYWMYEGFLEDEDDPNTHIDAIREKGHSKIRELRGVCLLEDDGMGEKGTVRLHDTIRDMLLWINRKEFLVVAGARQVPPKERWGSASRVSFMGNLGVKGIPDWEHITCKNLTTILGSLSELRDVPAGFFQSVTTHRVLELSDNFPMRKVPIEVTNLLVLQYLNLSHTGIDRLPMQLGNLRELRQLVLEHTTRLRKIPREAISRLSKLQALKMEGSSYNLNNSEESDSDSSEESDPDDGDNLDWSDLEEMGSLYEMSVSVKSCLSMDRFSRCSTALKTRVRSLEIILQPHYRHKFCMDVLSRAFNEPMQELRRLRLTDAYRANPLELAFSPDQLTSLEELLLIHLQRAKIEVDLMNPNNRSGLGRPPLQSLQQLELRSCDRLTDLKWVGQLPSLTVIKISSCSGVTDLLLDECLPDDCYAIFPKLRHMELRYLAALRSISRQPLLLPSLEELVVMDCPELKHLPLRPESAQKLRVIVGSREWWENLEWHDDQMAVKSKFHDHFRAEEACNLM